MQTAWQANEFDSMRFPYMTDALYSQFKLQLDELIRSECTNHVERIAVLGLSCSAGEERWKLSMQLRPNCRHA